MPVKATQELIREMLVNAIIYEKDGNPSDVMFSEIRQDPTAYASGKLNATGIGRKPTEIFELNGTQVTKLMDLDPHTLSYCRDLVEAAQGESKDALTKSLADLVCAAIVIVNWSKPT